MNCIVYWYSQLEELLELNQQLQQELTSIQNEKDDLTSLLQKETDASLKWHKEKVREVIEKYIKYYNFT